MRSRPSTMDHPSRRAFLADAGLGFTGLAMGAMLFRDGIVRADAPAAHAPSPHIPPDGVAHLAPRARHVIWLFMLGGVSQVESFDPKPALNKYAGKEIGDTPYKDALTAPFLDNVRAFSENMADRHLRKKIFPMQVGYKKHGQSGIEVTDWWPHVASCVDDIAVVRSMWTTDNDHAAQLQFHTGRHVFDGFHPTIGSWVHYGLGALNDNLPSYVVLGRPIADCCGGAGGHGASYLGPEHAGVTLSADPKQPLPFATPAPGSGVTRKEQAAKFDLINRLNSMSAANESDDAALRARIRSYELAFGMQMAVPGVVDISRETDATRAMYGLDHDPTRAFGQQCLLARRLVEKGVRFVQVFHGGDGGAGGWDAHSNLKDNHARMCAQVDQPIAALLRDLKQRGLLDETLVVWATEFGRTPGAEGANGRDHHPTGFSVWLAGGGVRGGITHGATDELGFHAVEHRHYVTDVHATVLHQLGLDPRRLEVPGRKRLEMDHGHAIRHILA